LEDTFAKNDKLKKDLNNAFTEIGKLKDRLYSMDKDTQQGLN
jgi:hypothetical protein